MSEKGKIKQGQMDCFEQKLASKLSEELSGIQVSEELIQRTLQAASGREEDFWKAGETAAEFGSGQKTGKGMPGNNRRANKERTQNIGEIRKKIPIEKAAAKRRRLPLLQGCLVAAALLVIVLGFRSIRFQMKNGGEMEGNLASGGEGGWDSNGKDWNGGNDSDGQLIGSVDKSMEDNGISGEGVPGNLEMDGSMQMPQGVPSPYPEELGDGQRKEDNTDNAGAIQGQREEAEKERLISEAVSVLLLDIDETAGIVELDCFTEAEGMDSEGQEEAYQEFLYLSEDGMLEITARVYPDGSLEGRLIQQGKIMYKAAIRTPGMERLWEILGKE